MKLKLNIFPTSLFQRLRQRHRERSEAWRKERQQRAWNGDEPGYFTVGHVEPNHPWPRVTDPATLREAAAVPVRDLWQKIQPNPNFGGWPEMKDEPCRADKMPHADYPRMKESEIAALKEAGWKEQTVEQMLEREGLKNSPPGMDQSLLKQQMEIRQSENEFLAREATDFAKFQQRCRDAEGAD